MAVLDKWARTFSEHDYDGYLSTYHFPHFRLAGGKLVVLQSKADLPREIMSPKNFPPDYDHTKWVSRDIVQASPDKVYVAVVFRRYRKDGAVIGENAAMYVLDKVDGQWGMRGRSSFAE